SLLAALEGAAMASKKAATANRRITLETSRSGPSRNDGRIIAEGTPAPVREGARSAGDREVCAPVLGPRLLRTRGVEESLLAVGDGPQARLRDAQAHQVFLGRPGPLLAQGEVVLGGAALVAMSFDRDLGLAVTLQPEGVLLQGRPRVVREDGRGVVEGGVGGGWGLPGGVRDVKTRASSRREVLV